MRTLIHRAFFVVCLVGSLVVSLPALAEGLFDALANGTPKLELRLSYENSDVKDNGTDAASSMTMRTRVGYKSGNFGNSSLTFQLQDISALVRNYSPVRPGYDKVADVEGAGVQELYLDSKLNDKFSSRLGRQEIIMRDARLIGNIGWRQHGQSFDALKVTGKLSDNFTVLGGYVTRIKTIFNTQANIEYLGMMDVTYTGIKGHSIAGMAYLLDALGNAPTDRDKATYSLRAQGKFGQIEYMADYVTQKKYADATAGGGTMVRGFVASKVGSSVKIGVGYSSLSGASGTDRAFDTLFSTAHKFNGWSDQFLSTNGGGLTAGINDMYFQAGGSVSGSKLLARYHIFDMETGSGTYGNEIDLLWKKKLHPHLTGLLKVAIYSADAGNTAGVGSHDETVFWARGIYKF